MITKNVIEPITIDVRDCEEKSVNTAFYDIKLY